MDGTTCETCGNAYDRAFTVTMPGGATHVFDSFECAIERLAPRCAHCGCRVIGHGMEYGTTIYCCSSCLRMAHPDLGADNAEDADAPHREFSSAVAMRDSFPASDPPPASPRTD